jgi:hypothetical protein
MNKTNFTPKMLDFLNDRVSQMSDENRKKYKALRLELLIN